ncbi:MAG: hypothetical protein J1F18_02810 [Lachnospiraceae bacterium]|nr:hypothetical protein [Lachnospiraceae bacterium]
MSKINDIRLEQAIEIQKIAEWDCGEHPEILQKPVGQYSDGILQEHIEQCLDEMLGMYISDERNYVVDCAEIECTEMCDNAHCIKYENGKTTLYDVIKGGDEKAERNYIPSGKSQGQEVLLGKELDIDKVRRLYALHAKEADDNGIRYATVVDTTCLRNVKEGTGRRTSPIEGELSCEASIVSCGNCGILKESDIGEIEKRLDESKKYGTCYSLIKPVAEWVNPLCAESVSGNCDQKVKDFMFGTKLIKIPCDSQDHHRVMEFDTNYGTKQGLTMLSTLLCMRGGVITIKVHGQIYLELSIEDRIQKLMDLIDGNPIEVNSSDPWGEMCGLLTVEILARVIYQEARGDLNGQNQVMFSIINRPFSGKNFTYGESTSLYNILIKGGYKSITKDNGKTLNGQRPPNDNCDDENEIKAWENAKRLAAITVIALEEYGGEYEEKEQGNGSIEKVIKSDGFDETYNQIVEFIQQQVNYEGEPIKNEIDTKDSFYGDGKKNHFYYM